MEVREESQRLHQLAYGYTPGNIESLGRIYCSWVLSFAFDIVVLVANTCNFSRGDWRCRFQRGINAARLYGNPDCQASEDLAKHVAAGKADTCC